MKNIWVKKSLKELLLDTTAESNSGLKRSLTRFNLIFLGIGGIIGAGIFVLSGTAAANFAGPAVSLSFIVAGIACAFAGLCYAELASMIPIAGSAYTYAYATMGEFIAWIIGWDLILEYLFACSTVAVGWSGYVVSFIEKTLYLDIPDVLVNSPYSFNPETKEWVSTGAIVNLPAMIIIAVLSAIIYRGVKESANFNNIVVGIKLTVIALFIVAGLSFINSDNLTPYIPENQGGYKYGIPGIFRAAGVIFFAYIGFDSVSTAAQEAKNPQKDMPWGILGSLVICTIIYVIFSIVLTGMVPYTDLNHSAPVAVAIDAAGSSLNWLSPIIKLGAIAGLSSVILIMAMAQSRIFYTMSQDGLLPKIFGKVHTKYNTPYMATIITGVVASTIGGLFPIDLLGELVSIGTLFAFIVVSIGVLVLRIQSPEIERPFKAPFYPFTPILGVITSFGVMYFLPFDTWLRLIIWLVIGLAIYYFYGYKNSVLGNRK